MACLVPHEESWSLAGLISQVFAWIHHAQRYKPPRVSELELVPVEKLRVRSVLMLELALGVTKTCAHPRRELDVEYLPSVLLLGLRVRSTAIPMTWATSALACVDVPICILSPLSCSFRVGFRV